MLIFALWLSLLDVDFVVVANEPDIGLVGSGIDVVVGSGIDAVEVVKNDGTDELVLVKVEMLVTVDVVDPSEANWRKYEANWGKRDSNEGKSDANGGSCGATVVEEMTDEEGDEAAPADKIMVQT